jgi:hypothetical protein
MNGAGGRDELGGRLKALFDNATPRMTTTRAAELLTQLGIPTSQPTVSRILKGRVAAKPAVVDQLARIADATEEERAELVRLAEEIHKGNRRLVLGRDPAAAQTRIGRFSREAKLIRAFALAGFPGEVQERTYIRAIFGGSAAGARQRELNQSILDDDGSGRRWVFLMPEGALGFPSLIAAEGMARQIDRLAEASRRPNIRVGIIPWGTECPVLPLHNWYLYDANMVVIGGKTFALDLTDPEDVAAYVTLTDQLERLAVYDDDARTLLRAAADRYRRLK